MPEGGGRDRTASSGSQALLVPPSPSGSRTSLVVEGELWRLCVDWLVRCGVLDGAHRVTTAAADILDFAQILRDGVLLCQLANRLAKGSIDFREVSLRPQLSQFLCLKNICLFLGACQTAFDIAQRELFEAWHLYKVADFAKVLQTLSRVSNSNAARLTAVPGFSDAPPQESASRREYYNDEIYRTLAEEAEAKELEEEVYSDNIDQEEYGKIYDAFVSSRPAALRRSESSLRDEFVPTDRREHCIKELLDTERNYVDALNMLLQRFYTPLRQVLSPDDHSTIFINMQELAQIHTAFQSELGKAVRQSRLSTAAAAAAAGTEPRIGDVFVRWKGKFVAYSDYCARLPAAQQRVEQLCHNSAALRQKIIECQADANQNKFRLQDLLSVPMQRVLKYHLLMKELVKCTPPLHEDKLSLDAALEAMVDLSFYINEVKRDCETLQVIKDIQNSIVDLTMPPNTDLKDYGRLLKDGELKLCSHAAGSKVKNRYVFVFDKVLMICKNFRANQYAYKSAIVLSDFAIDDPEAVDNNNKPTIGGTLLKAIPKWTYTWSLTHREGTNVFQCYTKSQELKVAWISAIRMAHDNVEPAAIERLTEHSFSYCNFSQVTECSNCAKLLRGLFFQGYRCHEPVCQMAVHKECLASTSQRCGRPPSQIFQRHSASFASRESRLEGQLLRAVRAFHGNNGGPQFLSFNENDIIEIISTRTEMEGWWKGRVVEASKPGRIGLFPADYVYKQRHSITPSMSSVSSRTHPQRSVSRGSGTWPRGLAIELDGNEHRAASVERRPSTASSISPTIAPTRPAYVNLDAVASHPWFEPVDRELADRWLSGMPDGTFLVRFSDKQQRYALSLSFEKEVKHVKIELDENGKGYCLDDTKYFSSVPELVGYFERTNLRESFAALNTTLRAPLKSVVSCWAVAQHSFEATAPNMVSLRKGDRLAILSKAGGERGWWKGNVGGKVAEQRLRDADVGALQTDDAEEPAAGTRRAQVAEQRLRNADVGALQTDDAEEPAAGTRRAQVAEQRLRNADVGALQTDDAEEPAAGTRRAQVAEQRLRNADVGALQTDDAEEPAPGARRAQVGEQRLRDADVSALQTDDAEEPAAGARRAQRTTASELSGNELTKKHCASDVKIEQSITAESAPETSNATPEQMTSRRAPSMPSGTLIGRGIEWVNAGYGMKNPHIRNKLN